MDISLNGFDALAAKLAALPDAVQAMVLAKSQDLADTLVDKIRDDKLEGGVLADKTGRLRDSIASSAESDGDMITSSVFVAGDVPYAAIQEYGGTTKAHIIEAINGKALAFDWHGKDAIFKRVNHPGSVIPERSYLRSSLDDMQDDITDGMNDALSEAIAL